jgi:hypothetical protein
MRVKMTNKTKQNILELYDEALDKNKAIRDIAKTIGVPQEEIRDVVYENGRPIPPKRTKAEPKEEPDDFDCPDDEAAAQEPEEAQEAAVQLPIPNYIFDVLMRELDTLDMQINALSQKLADLSTKYTDISKFIKEYKRP